jgi:hypothetical protein
LQPGERLPLAVRDRIPGRLSGGPIPGSELQAWFEEGLVHPRDADKISPRMLLATGLGVR